MISKKFIKYLIFKSLSKYNTSNNVTLVIYLHVNKCTENKVILGILVCKHDEKIQSIIKVDI